MKLSVIVPAYKAEGSLRHCAASILQGAGGVPGLELELILVEDGSPDGTGAVCDALAAEDARITALHRPNGGAAAARNTGLAAAGGEYIAFVDADDELLPGVWAEVLPVLQAERPDLYDFGLRRKSGPPEVVECGPAGHYASLAALGEAELARLLTGTGVLVSPCAKCYRAALLQAGDQGPVRFDPALAINEDLLFNLAFLRRCGPVVFGPGAFYQYNDTGAGSLSRQLRDDLLTADAYIRPALLATLAALGLSEAAAARVADARRLHCAIAQFGLLAGRPGKLPRGRRAALLREIFAVPGARDTLLRDYRADPKRLLALPYRFCLRLRLPGLLAGYLWLKNHFL